MAVEPTPEDLKRRIWEEALKEKRIVCNACKTIVVSKVYCHHCYQNRMKEREME